MPDRHSGIGVSQPRRPRLHFTPTSGWINDPYGVTWHDGQYHLFYQHVPGQVVWSPAQHWGHAVSDDLVHWTERAIVLSPDDQDGGIWSGGVTRTEEGDALMLYTAVQLADPGLGTIRAARPADASWNVWRKEGSVVAPPEDLELAAFRDPFVLHDGETWRMIVGAGSADGTALVLTWTSPDLTAWTYGGVLASRPRDAVDPVWTGAAWECPQLFRLDDAWVLVVSVWAEHQTHYEAYAVGDLVEGRFTARTWRRLSYGAVYAGSTFTDAEGRRCLLHWLCDVADPRGDWAGAHSVPHVVHLEGDRLVGEPHPAFASEAVVLRPGSREMAGDAVLRLDEDTLHVDMANQSFTMPSTGGEVQIIVDAAVVEVFGRDGIAGFVTNAPDR
jgi:beta-fructofuranosidase